MNEEHREIGKAASQLGARLPYSVLVAVSTAISRCPGTDWLATRTAVLQSLPTPDFRDLTGDFLEVWRSRAPGVSPKGAAVALLTAAESAALHRRGESVETVWTGPEPAESRFRQTEQAVLEVIGSAKKRLTLVSYAVYRIPRIREALVAAAQRGVRIRLIVETPSLVDGQGEYDCLIALGSDVASCCSVYYWPPENRSKDPNGKVGILHVKCAVADSQRMFLSSANLTEYAFTIHMELGVLLTGGKQPGAVERHFEKLIETGVFLPVSH